MFVWRNRSRSVSRSLGGLARDQGGAIAVILAVLLGAIAGMMALAMDLGKAWIFSITMPDFAASLTGEDHITI